MTTAGDGVVPPRRRLHVRAAITGSVDEFVSRVRAVIALPFGGAEASLSMLYMLDHAARNRPPDQVAAIAVAFRGEPGEDAVLDAASMRGPVDLAAIVTADRALARPLLQRAMDRRLPGELAELLVALPERDGLGRQACEALLAAMSPAKVALVSLHLRGMNATGHLTTLLDLVAQKFSSPAIAEFLVHAHRLGDAENAGAMIAKAAAWRVKSSEGIPDIGRIARLIGDLLEGRHTQLAAQVTDQTLEGYKRSQERYRLYALVFVFKQHGLDTEAARVRREIPAGASAEEATDLIIRFCQTEEPDQAAALLHTILESPEREVTTHTAVEFTRRLEKHKYDVFQAAATWSESSVAEFEKSLAGYSIEWAEEFRSVVAAVANERADGVEIADLIDWLYRDRKQGKENARILIEGTVRRGDPAVLADVIHGLRANKSWWECHRDEFRRRISAGSDVGMMATLVTSAAEAGCLPAALWLSQDWLTHRARPSADVIRVVQCLHDANGNQDELRESMAWAGHKFHSLPDQDLARSLWNAGLQGEAAAWNEGKRRMRVSRPDPDPRR